MHRLSAAIEAVLVLALGVSAFGLGAAASTLAEPAADARLGAAPSITRPVPPAVAAAARAGEVRPSDTTRRHASGALPPITIPAGQSRAEPAAHVGSLAVWNASYEPQDARIALVHVASAARGRPLAYIYIAQDWIELLGTGSGSHAHSARPPKLAESTGA